MCLTNSAIGVAVHLDAAKAWAEKPAVHTTNETVSRTVACHIYGYFAVS